MHIWKFWANLQGYLCNLGSMGSETKLSNVQGPMLQFGNIRWVLIAQLESLRFICEVVSAIYKVWVLIERSRSSRTYSENKQEIAIGAHGRSWNEDCGSDGEAQPRQRWQPELQRASLVLLVRTRTQPPPREACRKNLKKIGALGRDGGAETNRSTTEMRALLG